MKVLEKVAKRAATATQKSAENVAVRNAGFYCRVWLGVPKVPSKLLEKGVR